MWWTFVGGLLNARAAACRQDLSFTSSYNHLTSKQMLLVRSKWLFRLIIGFVLTNSLGLFGYGYGYGY